MERLPEFIANHPFLWAALALVLAALAASEFWRMLRGPKPVSPGEAVRLINSADAVVVDVRSASDFKKGHILHAVNVPLAGIDSRANEISKDKDRSIICYCAIGTAGPQACTKLKKQGYHNVVALKGGVNAWQSAGLPLTTK